MTLGRKIRHFRTRQELNILRIDCENMPWRACGGPDFPEIEETRVHEGPDRIQVPDGRDAPDGEAGLCPDQCRVGLAKRLACERGGLGVIHAVATRRQEQNGFPVVLATKYHGLDDLVDLAPRRVGGFLRRAGAAGHFKDVDVEACFHQRPLDSF